MKKLIIGLTILGLVGMALFPMVASAQQSSPRDCCRLNHTMIVDDPDVSGLRLEIGNPPNDVVGPSDSINCDFDDDGTNDVEFETRDWGLICTVDSVKTATDWVFYILLIISVVMIVIGGFYFVTASGNPERAGTGRRILTYAVIGIAIAVLARLVPSLVRAVVGL